MSRLLVPKIQSQFRNRNARPKFDALAKEFRFDLAANLLCACGSRLDKFVNFKTEYQPSRQLFGANLQASPIRSCFQPT